MSRELVSVVHLRPARKIQYAIISEGCLCWVVYDSAVLSFLTLVLMIGLILMIMQDSVALRALASDPVGES